MTGILNILINDLVKGVIGEVLYFPLWWYSRGLKKTSYFSWRKIASGWRASGLWSFFRNFFKPMYGARGIDAYILTLITRCWQMSWRFLVLMAWSFFWLLVLLVWLVLPVFLIWQLI